MSSLHIFLISAMTADGFIARDATHLSTKWTSSEDAKWFNQRTKQAQVVVMGRKTFATIGRALPGRVTIVMTSQPEALQKTVPSAHILTQDETPHLNPGTIWLTKLSPLQLVDVLEQQTYTELAVCGGSTVYTAFLQASLIQTCYLTVEPIFFGQGMRLFDASVDIQLQLQKTQMLSSQTMVLEYSIFQ